MSRKQEEQFEQDRLGNVNRKLDRFRAQEGMEDEDGIVEIGEDDVDEDVVLVEFPDHVDEAIVTELHSYNSTAEDGTYTLHEAELDDDGEITDTTQRSVRIEVAGEATRINSYEGKPFSGDAIAVNASFEGDVGVGYVADHKQYNESTAQQ